MRITERQRRWLKAQAHHRKAVVSVGQAGVTEGLLAELEGALAHHELLKVRVAAGDRDLRGQLVDRLTEATRAELITRVGNVVVLYRANPKKPSRLVLPLD